MHKTININQAYNAGHEKFFYGKACAFSVLQQAIIYFANIESIAPALPLQCLLLLFPIFDFLELCNYVTKCRIQQNYALEPLLFYSTKLLLNALGMILFCITASAAYLWLPVIAISYESIRSLTTAIELFRAGATKAAVLNVMKFIYFGCIAAGIAGTYIVSGAATMGAHFFAIPLILGAAYYVIDTYYYSIKLWFTKKSEAVPEQQLPPSEISSAITRDTPPPPPFVPALEQAASLPDPSKPSDSINRITP